MAMMAAERRLVRSVLYCAAVATILWSAWTLPMPYAVIVPAVVLVASVVIWFIGICLSPEPPSRRIDWFAIGRTRDD